MRTDYSPDEARLADALLVARRVQDFIWGDLAEGGDLVFDQAAWTAMFQKRVDAIESLDVDHPSAVVELRKRVLQQAALSVRALVVLDGGVAVRDRSSAEELAEVIGLEVAEAATA